NYTIGIKEDGRLFGWGYAGSGAYVPTYIGSAEDGWMAVAAGYDHTLVIKNDGRLYAWGGNFAGQLGDGTNDNRWVPTHIGGTEGDGWKAVSAGFRHTLAIKEDGRLYAWGYNFSGQLGDGTRTDKNRPTYIGAPEDRWKAVSAGNSSSLAITEDGRLFAWGEPNGGGGNSPRYIGSAGDGWKSVSAGFGSFLAIKDDGKLYAWGGNLSGELGDGTTASRSVPAYIGSAGDGWDVATVSFIEGVTGSNYMGGCTFALKEDGRLFAWGSNYYGQLGDGTAWRTTPVPIGGPYSGSAPDGTSPESSWDIKKGLVLDSEDDSGRSTGGGQLGDGTTKTRRQPVQVRIP
ncbi:MAG: hypothetical protein FWG12_08030, partial [Holophagaceae bacterium]|nr:hypothetical protein [Holophagaceae bacterium]